jgi:hypothetical protein
MSLCSRFDPPSNANMKIQKIEVLSKFTHSLQPLAFQGFPLESHPFFRTPPSQDFPRDATHASARPWDPAVAPSRCRANPPPAAVGAGASRPPPVPKNHGELVGVHRLNPLKCWFLQRFQQKYGDFEVNDILYIYMMIFHDISWIFMLANRV